MSKHVPPETQREKILDAAAACFTELGYDGTSVDAIADRSGLPKSAVSQHFTGKADIRTALFALWSERLSAWISSA
jgi:AcrR family transcriptional regulator